MRLDMDCVREVLLEIEKMPFNGYITIDQLCSALPEMEPDNVYYSALKLIEAGYLSGDILPKMKSYLPGIKGIYDITFQGHEFLNEIREPERWTKVKTISKRIGSSSLQAIWNIAQQLTVTLIQSALQ